MSAISFCALPLPHPLRFDLYLHALFPNVSRVQLKPLFERRLIHLNHKPVKKAEPLRGREEITLLPPALPVLFATTIFPNRDIPLVVLYEDDDLFVIDKPAGIATTPQSFLESDTLANAVLAHWPAGAPACDHASPNPLDVGLLQRLDRDTSGLVLGAKRREVWEILRTMMQQEKIEKIYLALVHGTIPHERGAINWLITSRSKHSERVRVHPQRVGAHRTAWRAVERFGTTTLLSVSIRQGARHQIRAHLAALGHPIVGDSLYGDAALSGLPRQFLHAHELRFSHPITHKALVIQSPLPPDLSTELQHSLNRR